MTDETTPSTPEVEATPDAPKHDFICEVCGTAARLSNEEAFSAGWDYPPFIGAWGIISPRTCPNCGVEGTLWWGLMTGEVNPDALTEKQRETALRILSEKAR